MEINNRATKKKENKANVVKGALVDNLPLLNEGTEFDETIFIGNDNSNVNTNIVLVMLRMIQQYYLLL